MIEMPKCDLEKYREHVKDFDLSLDEQTDLLKTIWRIMASFVDLGFGVDSIQLLSSSSQKWEPSQSRVLDEKINSKGVKND